MLSSTIVCNIKPSRIKIINLHTIGSIIINMVGVRFKLLCWAFFSMVNELAAVKEVSMDIISHELDFSSEI